MKWLQIGASKSGNLWLYHILQRVAFHTQLPQQNFIQKQAIHAVAKHWDLSFKGQADIDTMSIHPYACYYRISGVFNMPIADVDDYIAQTSHVWTQSFFSPLAAKVLQKFEKKVYIIRDPRDRSVSLSRYTFTPYRQKYFPINPYRDQNDYLDKAISEDAHHWARHTIPYLQHRDSLDIYVVFYERLLQDFDGELIKLLAYLGVTLDEEKRRKVKEEVSFASMKSGNPQHVRKGVYGEWSELLSRKQNEAAKKMAGPLLAYLGYPLDPPNSESQRLSLPTLPNPISVQQLENLLSAINRRWTLQRIRRVISKKLLPIKPSQA